MNELADTIPIQTMSDEEIQSFLKENNLALKVSEAQLVAEKIGRNPTLTELFMFDAEWSEHCSYKSSKDVLKQLPTNASNVILGPVEDSGIVHFTDHKGETYGIVVSHESHNHPSQVVPYEGAATGIGGIIRDILCMGARIIAVADSLRFGNPAGKNKNKVRYITNTVVDGIAGYGNPVGIPNLAGEIYFEDSFDENGLVNVVSLGLVKKKDIIHSIAPGPDMDIVIVGKATDNSGFGGASFASLILEEEKKEQNRGAVQVPNPFLKNVLIRATEKVFEEIRKQNITAGFKDMGAGGTMCSTSELCQSGGVGADITIDKIHTAFALPPFITACSETQERFTWIVPKEFTPTLLKIYNKDFALPEIADKAQASVIGTTTKEKQYILWEKGKKVCDLPIDLLTSGIKYQRESSPSPANPSEPTLLEPQYLDTFKAILSHRNVCSREKIYKHYDTEVQGNAVIRPGEADAGLLKPIQDSPAAVALSTDANPRYSRISPYYGAVAAVAESMRNVAAVGATPSALTDCLNFGNPEIPEAFWQFQEAVRGVADAARQLSQPSGEPVPVISGNVSFYNETPSGRIDPSPIIACIGVMPDYKKAITLSLKQEGNLLFLLGERKPELGGSVYYDLHGELGASVPQINFNEEKKRIHTIIQAIDAGLLASCHDISDGGLAASIAEMAIVGKKGCSLTLPPSIRSDIFLFSESPGFICEVPKDQEPNFQALCSKNNCTPFLLGKVQGDSIKIKDCLDLSVKDAEQAWSVLPELIV